MEDPTSATLRTQQLSNHELLDTHQSVPESEGGRAGASNRLSLCKIHHAACDKNIQGINEVSRVEGPQDIHEEINGPMLSGGVQALHHQRLYSRGSRNIGTEKEFIRKRQDNFRYIE